jgi:triacylglycerol lipase
MAANAELLSKDEVAAGIRRMGRKFDQEVLQGTYELYKPLQERAPKQGVEITRDVAYGPHARHRLDLFVPSHRPTRPAPVVVYVHGGGYVGGERSPMPGLFYDNVTTFFARHGIVGVNMTYRLAPEFKWPSGAKDVGTVVAWLKQNVAQHGGDPDRIFLMGQSAGASHVATWTFMPEVHGATGPGIAGAMLLSGVYASHHPEFNPDGKPSPNHLAYFGEDTTKWAAMSPLPRIAPGHPPVYVCVTEFDPYPLAWPSSALLAALEKCDKAMPWFRVLRNHNHVSPALQINSEVDTLGPELLQFIQSV